jgi:hypothetical protein
VYGPTPPVEVKVAEYGTLITAADKGVVLMTRGRGGRGGAPLWQEKVKRRIEPQITRREERFNAVMNDL